MVRWGRGVVLWTCTLLLVVTAADKHRPLRHMSFSDVTKAMLDDIPDIPNHLKTGKAKKLEPMLVELGEEPKRCVPDEPNIQGLLGSSCCKNLKCGHPKGVCCQGSSHCCPQATVCVQGDVGTPPGCLHILEHPAVRRAAHLPPLPQRKKSTAPVPSPEAPTEAPKCDPNVDPCCKPVCESPCPCAGGEAGFVPAPPPPLPPLPSFPLTPPAPKAPPHPHKAPTNISKSQQKTRLQYQSALFSNSNDPWFEKRHQMTLQFHSARMLKDAVKLEPARNPFSIPGPPVPVSGSAAGPLLDFVNKRQPLRPLAKTEMGITVPPGALVNGITATKILAPLLQQVNASYENVMSTLPQPINPPSNSTPEAAPDPVLVPAPPNTTHEVSRAITRVVVNLVPPEQEQAPGDELAVTSFSIPAVARMRFSEVRTDSKLLSKSQTRSRADARVEGLATLRHRVESRVHDRLHTKDRVAAADMPSLSAATAVGLGDLAKRVFELKSEMDDQVPTTGSALSDAIVASEHRLEKLTAIAQPKIDPKVASAALEEQKDVEEQQLDLLANHDVGIALPA